jgi:two-component sensor histidine kinase
MPANTGRCRWTSAESTYEWRLDGDIFTISWTERNGPPVSRPERRGLGSTVVDSMAKLSVGGEVELDYAPLGLTWRLTCPAMNAVELRRKGRNFRALLTWAVQQVVSYL